MSTNQKDYSACKDIKRQKPSGFNQDADDASFDLLPLFEKSLFDNTYTKHCSLETNELLRCRWKVYKEVNNRVYAPFNLIDKRDIHFYLNTCRYSPSETINRRTNYRNQLRPGPGVDSRGQIPTPQELHMKRLGGGDPNRKYPKKYPKVSKITKLEEKKKVD